MSRASRNAKWCGCERKTHVYTLSSVEGVDSRQHGAPRDRNRYYVKTRKTKVYHRNTIPLKDVICPSFAARVK